MEKLTLHFLHLPNVSQFRQLDGQIREQVKLRLEIRE
jgi:hypothetical protein